MILVTGGAGCVGANVARRFADLGYDVVAHDISWRTIDFFEKDPKIRKIEGNILHQDHITGIIKDFGIEGIVHTAAVRAESVARTKPAATVVTNVIGTLNLLEAARTNDVKRFIFTSTVAVYGPMPPSSRELIEENRPLNPKGIYSASKVAAEVIGDRYYEMFDVDFVILRLAIVYGPYQTYENFISILLRRAILGQPIIMPSGGDQPWNCVYVKDVAKACALAYEARTLTHRAFNLISDRRTMFELVKIIRKLKPDVKVEVGPGLADQKTFEKVGYTIGTPPGLTTYSIKRAQEELGYEPEYNLEKGMEEFFNWLKVHATQ